MKTDVKSDLTLLRQKIEKYFGGSCLNYGEGHEVITDNNGANYQAIELQKPCSTDDNFETVIFFVRTGSEPAQQNGGGYKTTLSRRVNFKLIGNSKSDKAEFNLAFLVNSIPGITFLGTDNAAKSIAQVYFGTEEHNFETYFFAVDFTVTEIITCPKC